MSRRSAVHITSLVLTLALALVACDGGGSDPGPSPTPVPVPTTATSEPTATPSATSSEPTGSTTPDAATEDEQAAQGTLTYFLVRDAAGQLWVEPVSFTYDVEAAEGAVAREAITRWLAAPDEDGLVNLVPDGTSLVDIDLDGTVLTVDLSGDVATNPGAGAAGEAAFAQALAHTGGQFPTVESVQLLVDGQPVTELWGHLDWSQPIDPDPFALSPIVVTAATGSSDGTIELAGTSNTFEATMDVVVTSGGATVEETFVTATCGTGCRGDWTYGLDGLEPGTYTVTLTEPDPSDGEGRPPFEVTVDVRVPA